jgi:hypothetical protein
VIRNTVNPPPAVAQSRTDDRQRLVSRTRRKLTFWALMIIATFALSEFLAAWRAWRAAPSPDHAAAATVLGLALVGAVAWLGFLLYEVDRAAGRIRHEVRLYEWIIARRRSVLLVPATRARAAHAGSEVLRHAGQEAVSERPGITVPAGGGARAEGTGR